MIRCIKRALDFRTMNTVSNIFLFLSGVDSNILKRCPTDRNKYLSIGATIFFTGLLAGIACGYALFTVFESRLISILGGAIWGVTILNLDRYLILSMKLRSGLGAKLLQALPRLILASLIALIIAKPLELKLFETEIDTVLVQRAQNAQAQDQDDIHDKYDVLVAPFVSQRAALHQQLETLQTRSNFLADEANKEADGTGGSNRRNMGPIYRAKKQDADNAAITFQNSSSIILPQIDSLTNQINTLEADRIAAVNSIDQTIPSGLASRIWALNELYKNSKSLRLAGIFIMLLFISLECAPIFNKLISSDSPYDYVLDRHESTFKDWHKERTTVSTHKVEQKLSFLKE